MACYQICDTCTHYAFNGDKDGAYTGDGRCEHPDHPRAAEPDDGCTDFKCKCESR
jgi:hypothetical protein